MGALGRRRAWAHSDVDAHGRTRTSTRMGALARGVERIFQNWDVRKDS
jgi:hypothetical protein